MDPGQDIFLHPAAEDCGHAVEGVKALSTTISRRRVLQGVGTGLLLAPWAHLVAPSARAQEDAVARRLVVFFSPNGTVHAQRRPVGEGADFSFPAGSILEPLDGVKDHLVLVDGLEFDGADNHDGGMAAMLTARGSTSDASRGMSLDQYVAAELAAPTRLPSLELGVQTSAWGGTVQTRMSYAGPDTFVTPDDNPTHVYERLFADLVGGDGAVEQLQSRRRRVIDLARDELQALRGRTGGAERSKLEAHAEALAQLEIAVTGGADCGTVPAPEVVDLYAHDAFPTVSRAQMDLLVMALACDATRVASLQLSHTVSPLACTWLGIAEGHHSLSHAADAQVEQVAQFVEAERWFAEQFAYLVSRMAEIPEPGGDGSMLDHSLVVWAKELGDGRSHVCSDVPFVLAGSAGGRLTTGRYLRVDGTPHNHLLVSICQAMGLSNETFGDESVGAGPLEGLR